MAAEFVAGFERVWIVIVDRLRDVLFYFAMGYFFAALAFSDRQVKTRFIEGNKNLQPMNNSISAWWSSWRFMDYVRSVFWLLAWYVFAFAIIEPSSESMDTETGPRLAGWDWILGADRSQHLKSSAELMCVVGAAAAAWWVVRILRYRLWRLSTWDPRDNEWRNGRSKPEETDLTWALLAIVSSLFWLLETLFPTRLFDPWHSVFVATAVFLTGTTISWLEYRRFIANDTSNP